MTTRLPTTFKIYHSYERHRWDRLGIDEVAQCQHEGCEWRMQTILIDRNRSMEDEYFKKLYLFSYANGPWRTLAELGGRRPKCQMPPPRAEECA